MPACCHTGTKFVVNQDFHPLFQFRLFLSCHCYKIQVQGNQDCPRKTEISSYLKGSVLALTRFLNLPPPIYRD